jgi:hypothetical protein
MTSTRIRRLVSLSFLGLGVLLTAACSGGGFNLPATQTPTAAPEVPTPENTAVVQANALPPSATPQPIATLPGPSPTTGPPPTQTPAPQPTTTLIPPSGVSLKPQELVLGGYAIVYLDEAADAATVTFGEKQYPMLRSGNRWWAIIGVGAFTRPGLAPVRVVYRPEGKNTQESIVTSIQIVERAFPIEHIELDEQTAALLAPEIVQNELNKRAAIYSGYTMQRMWSGPFQRPATAAISSTYGEGRSYNSGPVTDYHKGTDFAGEQGAPVYAAAAGRVVFADELQVRGNAIIIDHGAGVFSAYHHLSGFSVQTGEMVSAGKQIGAIGRTGLATGPHLHWEVIIRGVEVDGEIWLQGTEIGP